MTAIATVGPEAFRATYARVASRVADGPICAPVSARHGEEPSAVWAYTNPENGGLITVDVAPYESGGLQLKAVVHEATLGINGLVVRCGAFRWFCEENTQPSDRRAFAPAYGFTALEVPFAQPQGSALERLRRLDAQGQPVHEVVGHILAKANRVVDYNLQDLSRTS
jgi:hypothetical protein